MGGENQAQQDMTSRKTIITKHGCDKHFEYNILNIARDVHLSNLGGYKRILAK
jgi:hypothetical protein